MINRYASLKQGLVGAWCPSFGASGYRLLDRSGNNNHGTLTNMDPGTDWVPSGRKLALDFDGVNDRVAVPNSSNLQITGPITLSFWLNIVNNGGVRTIISKSTGADGEYELFADFRSGGSLITWRPGVGGGAISDFFLGYTGYWNHVAVTCNNSAVGANLEFYRNGVFVGGSTTNTARVVSNYDVTLASRPGGLNFATTQLDDVRIYNRVLTPSEILLLYTGGRGVGLTYERIKHRRKTSAAATNRRRRLICGANC